MALERSPHDDDKTASSFDAEGSRTMNMGNQHADISKQGAITTADGLLAGFAWAEAFVWFGIHCTWLLGKSTPLGAENTWGMLLAVVPVCVAIAAAALMCIRTFRTALLNIEWLLHLTSSTLLTALVLHVTLRDPFTGPVGSWDDLCVAGRFGRS
jgi:hypothetical protein